MKYLRCAVILLAIFWPETNVEDGFIIVDKPEMVLVEFEFINILHEKLRGGIN